MIGFSDFDFIEVTANLKPSDNVSPRQGFEPVAFSLMEKCTSVSLVSDGAEAVLISKKFFVQHLSDDMSKKLRTTVSKLG